MKILYTILAFICLTTISFSKPFSISDTTGTNEENNTIIEGVEVEIDSTNYEDNFDLSDIQYGAKNEFDVDEAPTIDLFYLMTTPRIHKDEFSSKFAKAAGFELKLGYLEKKPMSINPEIIEIDHNFVLLSNISSEFADKNSKDLKTSLWRFGLGSTSGYGWKFSENTDLSLYNSGAISWTSIDFKDTSIIVKETEKMKYFGDNFRFGTISEDGVKFTVFKPISVNVAYEKSLVFPRTMFWYWATSEIVEGIGHALVGTFIDKVIQKSPTFGPIVNWVLKSGISYGMNLLREKKMNWPINTEAPFVNESIKASLSFSF